MPRQPRRYSSSGYMHLIVRGVGGQLLFEDREDRMRYLDRLKRFLSETSVTLCAYCLMGNHVHLLVRDTAGEAALFMKKLGVSYAAYFNRKYKRRGHLFQDRYLSEAVEDDAYLLTVFRYILNNPKKAGIAPADRYEWSSYALYDQSDDFVDTALLRELIGDRQRYDEFLREDCADECMEESPEPKDDAWAREIMRDRLNIESGTELLCCGKKERNNALRQLKAAGLSNRQIERLTGIDRNIVQRA